MLYLVVLIHNAIIITIIAIDETALLYMYLATETKHFRSTAELATLTVQATTHTTSDTYDKPLCTTVCDL